MEQESVSRVLSDIANIGSLYRVKCSLWLDHGFGRLTVLADIDFGRSQVRLTTEGITADLENIPVITSEFPLEILLLVLSALVPPEPDCKPTPPKKPPVLDVTLSNGVRKSVNEL